MLYSVEATDQGLVNASVGCKSSENIDRSGTTFARPPSHQSGRLTCKYSEILYISVGVGPLLDDLSTFERNDAMAVANGS